MPAPAPSAPPAHRDLARITLSIIGLGLLIGGSVWVMLPFLGALLWATTIVVATWPILLRLQAVFGGRRGLAVTAMTVVLLLVLFIPLYLALSTILEQSSRIAELARGLPELRIPPPPGWIEALPVIGQKAAARWQAVAALPPDELAAKVGPYLATGLAWFAGKAGSFAGMVLHFLLTVLIAAILYAKGEGAAHEVTRFFTRLSGERGPVIVELAGKAVRAVALGIVVTAALQTLIAAIGLVAVGVPYAGFLSALVLVLCIAQVGPLLVLAPCVIWLYSSGSPGRGTALLVVTVLAQVIDNVVRPVLIKRGADLSLLLILPGVIGGLISFGVIGLFVGPVVLAVTANLLEGWMAAGLGDADAAAVAPTGSDAGAKKITPAA
ncbi:MAG TPA: AI-2E family transporter YdiK [Anaeromyxobacteraceae bacterium]|nr:AI-2E family transporter YdiK [Anaeromyxobacteraceae bacterium]